jgi:hypothetical protein
MEKDCGGEDIEYPDYGLRIEAAVINEIKNTSRFNQKRSTYFRTVTHPRPFPKGRENPLN